MEIKKVKDDFEIRNGLESSLIAEIVSDYQNGDTSVFSELISEVGIDTIFGSLSEHSQNIFKHSFEAFNYDRRKEIIHFLESLVYDRMTLNEISEKLSEYFGVTIEVDDVTDDKDETDTNDGNLMFNVNSNGVFLDGDIYVLPTREQKGFKNEIVYFITEVGYEFQ